LFIARGYGANTFKKIKRFIFYWEFYDVTDKKPKICESIRAKPAGNILNRNNFRNRASAKKVTLVICVWEGLHPDQIRSSWI